MKIRVLGPSYSIEVPLKVLENKNSSYQQIVVGESEGFGKCLVLDGEIQFATVDEYIYHEMLAYPPAIASGAKNALILGGGDGLLARRLLDFGIETSIVELDKEVMETCKKYFYEEGSSSLDEADIIIGDALEYTGGNYDLIYVDLIDYYKEPALYNREAMEHYKSLLNDSGIIVFHSDYPDMPKIKEAATPLFKNSITYAAYVPSFFSLWTFAMFSDNKIDVEKIEKSDIRGRYFSNDMFWRYKDKAVDVDPNYWEKS
ncbi:MAG: hypothetical protein D6769_03715, partial [Methanobacteriota archaeon]